MIFASSLGRHNVLLYIYINVFILLLCFYYDYYKYCDYFDNVYDYLQRYESIVFQENCIYKNMLLHRISDY